MVVTRFIPPMLCERLSNLSRSVMREPRRDRRTARGSRTWWRATRSPSRAGAPHRRCPNAAQRLDCTGVRPEGGQGSRARPDPETGRGGGAMLHGACVFGFGLVLVFGSSVAWAGRGWYFLIPPVYGERDALEVVRTAPLRQWEQGGAFD